MAARRIIDLRIVECRDSVPGLVVRREFAAAAASLTIVEHGIAHDDLRVQRVADVLRAFDASPGSRRVRIQAVVTRVGTDTLYVADSSDALQVAFDETPSVQVGDRVDIAGFPDSRRRHPSLVAAVVYRLGPGIAPQPQVVTAAQLMTGRHHAALVRVEATVTGVESESGRRRLVMKDETIAFEIRLPSGISDAPPQVGSRLTVVGVASIRFDEHGRATGFVLYPRQSSDVVVNASSAWRSSSNVFVGLSVTGGAVTLALGWLLLLNRRTPETEQALERSEARYREIFERSPAGNFISSHDGTVLACNGAFARMLGYASAADMTAINARDLYVDPSDRDEFLLQLRREGRIEGRETALKRADGTTLFALESAVARHDKAGVLEAEGYLIDLSRQKQAEAALLASEAQLRQAQRMEAMGRLAGGVSHDFNNLLTAILGHTELLLQDCHLDGRAHQHLLPIQKAATSAASLTRQLLAFSRTQVLKPAAVDVNAVVGDVGSILARILGEDVTLETQLAGEPAFVLADRGQLEQVLMNLAVNARDAMAKGGRLAIAVMLNQTEVHVHVRDTGAGIPADILPHIFEPFFTTKDPGSGTGLGLSTVYGIVTQSGGSLDVQATEGIGTTFMIRLPRFCALESTAGDRDTAATSRSRGQETVLVVEDEAAVRALVKATLEHLGYSVVLAEDGLAARKLLEQSRPAIDLVLSDVVMPKMSGAELTTTLRALHPELRVLLMSGYAGYPGCQMPKLPAGVPLLQKPFTPAALAASVRGALDATLGAGSTGYGSR